MNPRLMRALAEQRQAELRRAARRPAATVTLRPVSGVRRRIGMLLVETGLQLIIRAERRERVPVSSPLAR